MKVVLRPVRVVGTHFPYRLHGTGLSKLTKGSRQDASPLPASMTTGMGIDPLPTARATRAGSQNTARFAGIHAQRDLCTIQEVIISLLWH